MIRILVPSLCALVLAGCDGGQPQNTATSAPAVITAAAPAVVAPPPAAGTNEALKEIAAAAVPQVNPEAVAFKPPVELPAPVQEVVRLAQTTLGENVLLSYIGTITEPYKLSADQVIYLSDVGISSPVVSALLTRESTLRAALPVAAASTTAVGAPSAPPAPPAAVASGVTTTPPQSITANLNAATYADVPGGPAPQPPVVYGAPQPGVAVAPAQPAARIDPGSTVINYNTFYENLAPYGSWVEVADYGYCWRPTVSIVDSGWHPYGHNGSWVWSDYGWYWNSGYTWGWAPFHYGRWHRSGHLGWVWQPGCDWGPAWVNWSHTGEHCAWAPLPPECHWSSGVGFSWGHGGTRVSVGFGLTSDCWIGVGWSDFCRPRVWDRCVPRDRVGEIVSHGRSTVVGDHSQVVKINGNNNTVIINNGAPYAKAQAASREEIRKVAIADTSHPVAGGRTAAASGLVAGRPVISAYRPRLENPTTQPPAPAPAVLNQQRVEAQRTSAAPGVAANRVSPGTSPTFAPSRPSAAAGLTASPAPAVSASSGFQASRPAPQPAAGGNLGRVTAPTAPSYPSTARPSPAPGAATAPARPTAVLQDNSRIQNPSVSPRAEVRKPTAGYDYNTAPGSALRVNPRPNAAPAPAPYAPANPPAAAYSAPAAASAQRPLYVNPSSSARPGFDAPGFRSSPGYPAQAQAPSARYEGNSGRSYSAPAQAPSYSAPASRPSAPAPSYSAPPSRPSAPAPTYSAPAPSRSGGGKNGRDN